MRNLTRKQKRLLREEWQRIKDSGVEYPRRKDISHKAWIEIDDIHPCEIYYQNVVHYFDELNDEELDKKRNRTTY